jgi:hypothetical protein
MMGAVLAEVPALPLHTAGKYVAAAYIVLFALVLIYVAIMAIRLSRIERQLGELLELAERAPASGGQGAVHEGAPVADPHAGAPGPPAPDPVHVETSAV